MAGVLSEMPLSAPGVAHDVRRIRVAIESRLATGASFPDAVRWVAGVECEAAAAAARLAAAVGDVEDVEDPSDAAARVYVVGMLIAREVGRSLGASGQVVQALVDALAALCSADLDALEAGARLGAGVAAR